MRGMMKTALAAGAAMTVAAIIGCGGMKSLPSADYTNMEKTFAAAHGQTAFSYWHGKEGGHLAVAIDGDALVMYDLAGGEPRRFGKAGTEKNEFGKPVATRIYDDLLFVLERGNKRIQVFHLPDMESFGFFGETALSDPSSFAIYRIENAAFYVYVADTVKTEGNQSNLILRFSVSRGVNTIHSAYLQSFGYTKESGGLRTVRSLDVDQAARLLLADVGGAVRTYTLDGDAGPSR